MFDPDLEIVLASGERDRTQPWRLMTRAELLRGELQHRKARYTAYRPRPASGFDLAAWLAESRLRHAIPTTNLSAIRHGFDLSDPEDAAEAEARRLEKSNQL